MKKIWVVEDEENIRLLIGRYLEKEGYMVRVFSSAETLKTALTTGNPNMLVLDIMLPGIDGLSLCREIREKSSLPIIFVSARGEEFDKILGLELGGDDYLAKPFSPRELVVRVKNIFRRLEAAGEQGQEQEIKAGNMIIKPLRRQVLVGKEELSFAPREFDLLFLLGRNPGRPFTRQQLLDQLWGYDYQGDIRAVDDLVKRVRKKLREKGTPVGLTTVWGYGYRMDV